MILVLKVISPTYSYLYIPHFDQLHRFSHLIQFN